MTYIAVHVHVHVICNTCTCSILTVDCTAEAIPLKSPVIPVAPVLPVVVSSAIVAVVGSSKEIILKIVCIIRKHANSYTCGYVQLNFT